jgi:predicted metal-dependent phosphoesterase TrpH
LYNQINFDNWYFFPIGAGTNQTETPRGFYQWAVENKYKVGVTHPLEDAHKDAAELIKEKFNELVKKSI